VTTEQSQVIADQAPRYTQDDLEAWRKEGGVLIPQFFNAEEVAAVTPDFHAVFGTPESRASADALNRKQPGQVGEFDPTQFSGFDNIPLPCSPALNLIGLHPALIQLAQAALGTEKVHIYQCQAWAKFTGESDYDQPFHCDFANHTLTVPSEEDRLNSITILCYFSDVTDAHGPMNYVPRSISDQIAGPERSLGASEDQELQDALRQHARSSASPAGSIFAYGIDVYHRGTNLVEPKGYRHAVMACYKVAGNDIIGYCAWPWHHKKPWNIVFENASPQQLSCLGVPLPGHPFWNETTLRRAQVRWPGWDMTPYREALERTQ
jgi:hypothetical protein